MSDSIPTPTLILGAGLTGLSCAFHLGDSRRYRLIERETGVGGLARTRPRPHGFLCDGTGHWLHLRQDYAKGWVERLLGDNLEARSRRARVFSQGVFTLYPFQANTAGLPKETIAECVNGLIRARYEESHSEPTNYLQWIRKEFGAGICKHFMIPYNEKIYGVPLDSLAANFAQQYIPRPSVEAVVEGALGMSKEALGYNATFMYPKQGGIGALPEAIHAGVARPAELGREPVAIDLPARHARMKDGETIPFSRLVSTLPLNRLVDLLLAGRGDSVPAAVVQAKARLRANSVLYFDVALRGAPQEHQDYHWIYVPERSFPFYRVGSYSAVERSLAPVNHRSYYVELGYYGQVDPTRFEQPILDGLRRMGIIENEDDVLFMLPNVLSPAYVLFDDQYETARTTVLDWLDHAGVITAGRYGRWQYNAMEDALLDGREAARRIREEPVA